MTVQIIPDIVQNVLLTMGFSTQCRSIPDEENKRGWEKYYFYNKETKMKAFLFEHKAKTISDAKRQVSSIPHCVTFFHLKSNYSVFFKSGSQSIVFDLDSDDSCEQLSTILHSVDFASVDNNRKFRLAIKRVIKNIPTTTKNFNNRGVFSTHYLTSRLLKSDDYTDEIAWEGDAQKSLRALGWTDIKEQDGVYYSKTIPDVAILVVHRGVDFGMRKSVDDVAPSYKAVAELNNTPWVILTDGMTWRLYTSFVSASTTNYFEINLESRRIIVLRYLYAIFGAKSYSKTEGTSRIDTIFNDGKNYVQQLEDKLAERILKPDGVFVDLVKGILNHDLKHLYTSELMQAAKETALKIMYRIWFLLYAESRDLLPVKDERYTPLSLTSLRQSLDSMEDAPGEASCWEHVLELFGGIRNGSPTHNLPQYSGELFKYTSDIDNIKIKNRHFVSAIRGLFEKDGEPVDYASLGVRHLGNIYETLMEFVVRQADRDIMLIEGKGGMREVSSKAESTYTYRKNDIYILSKFGYISRKSSGSYYTPDDIVKFLVRRGLKPIFKEREKLIADDIQRYRKYRTNAHYNTCMDRLLDIQVLDPAMGSGHFLVEALNQITQWATGVLERYPHHPLLEEIEKDRELIIYSQKSRNITINESLLTHDVLLKRRIMKRCIFGVDINPLAVELARVSLWLDSFAIGVPLTYLNHHIKVGDSSIGSWRRDINDTKESSLERWMQTTDTVGGVIEDVSRSADVTIQQVRTSEDAHDEYERKMSPHKRMLDVYCAAQIDDTIIPKKTRKFTSEYIRRFNGKIDDADMQHTINQTSDLVKKYKFFHWELEMMDAFTDARYGFDLIVGNPPWDKLKPYSDEFFSKYDPTFRTITPNTKKRKRMESILSGNNIIKNDYDKYIQSYEERSTYYKTYTMQGTGDNDIWQIILERMLSLVSDNGIISILIPSQILTNTGCLSVRKKILDLELLQLYVFENRKKIFPIHSSYRFLLLTLRNAEGPDSFKAGFYLHNIESLNNGKIEKEKFHNVSKKIIRNISPVTLRIPETGMSHLEILNKVSSGVTMMSNDNWHAALSSGFHKTGDADLLKDRGDGWPVLQGKNIHQFNPNFTTPEFVANISKGIHRESKKQVYKDSCREFYNSYRVAFRDISGPTNVRTIIASIIPPQQFHTCTIYSIVLTQNNIFENNNDYNRYISYICGVLNSMTFDFMARTKVQMHTPIVIKTIPIPSLSLSLSR